MGLEIKATKRGATSQPITEPTRTEIRELMRRLRSSTRCSKKVMEPPDSASLVRTEESAAGVVVASGRMLGVMSSVLGRGGGGGLGFWRRFQGCFGGAG